jgi:integrase/recombinase XerC
MTTPFFIVDEFITFLKIEKRLSEHTCVAYKKDLQQFLEFHNLVDQEDLNNVNRTMVRSWLLELQEKSVSKRSVNRKLSTLRSFFKWRNVIDSNLENPVLKVQGFKTEKRLPNFVREADLKRETLESYFDESFEGKRNKLIIEIFYQTGIRLSELINLKKDAISSNEIKVLGKRNKERLIPISNELYNSIQELVIIMNEQSILSPYLFTLKNSNKLYPKLVYRIINCYLGNVTSMDRRSPHVLRHTFATHMLNNGAGLETLKELLGHANLSATQVYTHNSFTQLNNIYSLAHPRGHKKK